MEIVIEAEYVAIFLFDIAEWVKGVKIEYTGDKPTLSLFLGKLQMLIMLVKRISPCEFATYMAFSSCWQILVLGLFEIMGKGLYLSLSYIVRESSFFLSPYYLFLHHYKLLKRRYWSLQVCGSSDSEVLKHTCHSETFLSCIAFSKLYWSISALRISNYGLWFFLLVNECLQILNHVEQEDRIVFTRLEFFVWA